MLRKKRGALALLDHGSLALSVCCGWRKKKEAFWFKYFWGAKGKQKHRRRAGEAQAASTCPAELNKARPGPQEGPEKDAGREGGIRRFGACAYQQSQKPDCRTQDTFVATHRFFSSPNPVAGFEQSRENVGTVQSWESG